MTILNEAYSSAKTKLKSTKLARTLYKSIRSVIVSSEEITHLSQLIEQNQVAVLRPWLQMKSSETHHKIVHEITKQFLKELQTIKITKPRMEQVAVSTGTVLLRQPLALLAIPSAYEEYLKETARGHRRMVQKTDKEGYTFREFNWDDYLDDIFKINTSKETRSGGAMSGWYLEQVKPINLSSEEQLYRKSYGVFKDGVLYAYLYMTLCGDCGVFKYAIGHADHLKYGIMNYLISCIVREYVAHPQIKWLYYGVLPVEASGSTADFRKHAGFKSYATFLDLEDDEELLRYSKSVRAKGLLSV
ncbi:MAG: hypothetical protein ABFD08_13160 [Syntrophomonas sp.]